MRANISKLVLVCVFAAVGAVQAEDVVSVSFVDAARFSDIGATALERDNNLRIIAQHLQRLGRQYLQPGQALKIDVLDVDLAGTVKPSRRGGGDVRVANGLADFPAIRLRYALESPGQPQQSGEASITDLDYLHRIDTDATDPLRHEKRALDDWFKARFADSDKKPGS